jgi:sulfide dehydrogenase cytochrome subunit
MNRKRVLCGCLLALATAPALVLAQTTTGVAVPGRLLASNCYQCHGTNGNGGFERLAGMSASEIIGEMREMRTENPPEMMDVHARGYTDAQIKLIADYFSKLPRR